MEELSKDQIKAISEKFQQMNRYDERLRAANQLDNDKREELVQLINSILNNNSVPEVINSSHVRFNADYIGNIVGITDKKLSEIIFNAIYPAPKLKVYAHYTTFNGACSILKNKELWMFNLIKNFDAEEFRLFYEEHNVTGYRDIRETFGVRTDYRSLMSELYSLCLTSDVNNSSTLWNYFGYQGTGIKLTFEIDSKIPDFREVYYSNKDTPKQIKLLSDLFNEISEKYNYPFNFTYISKIGAFYIHGKFKNEQEYRFLVKRGSDNYDAWDFTPVTFKDDISYIIVPFSSKLAEFKLKKVTKGPNCKKEDFSIIKKIIEDNYSDPIQIEE